MRTLIFQALAVSFAGASLGIVACSGDSSGGGCGGASAPPATVHCSQGQHQEGDTCVKNPVKTATDQTATTTPAGATPATPATSACPAGTHPGASGGGPVQCVPN